MMNRYMHSVLSAAAVFSLILPVAAHAQYTGPSKEPVYKSVAEILKTSVDDRSVVLTGHVLKKVSNEKYTFSDGDQEIRVEIDDDIFPTTPIDEKTRVEIRGELEKDYLESPEVDVDSIKIIK